MTFGTLSAFRSHESRYRRDLEVQRTTTRTASPDAYRALLAAAMRRVATDPQGISTNDRADLQAGIRSFHVRHCREESREGPVAHPVHVIFYRALRPDLVEIVRVLHERMQPSRHLPG